MWSEERDAKDVTLADSAFVVQQSSVTKKEASITGIEEEVYDLYYRLQE